MKKLVILLALALTAQLGLFANISSYYTFNSALGNYVSITGTEVPSAIGDNLLSSIINIGFNFNYGISTYTQLRISSNGYIALGSPVSQTSTNNLASTENCPVIAPLWDDLSMIGGSVQYLLTGTQPNRILTIQFSNAHWNYISQSLFSFQAKLFETGKIEFNYGPSTGISYNGLASIGINMLPGGNGNFCSVTPGNPATVSNETSNNLINTFPDEGTVYSFNPIIHNIDLAALSITGNPTPTVNCATNYTVTVKNLGVETQSNYLVLLMTGENTLAGSTGITANPGQSVDITVSFTPTVSGLLSIYGKVVLTGDENPTNDATPTLNIAVQSSGTIPDPPVTHLARYPMDFYWKNSLSETIYPETELQYYSWISPGTVNSIVLYNNFTTSVALNKPTKIWMGTTTSTDLSSGWIPASALQLVFDGAVNYPVGYNSIYFNLQNPFVYTGGNLVVMFNRPMDTEYYNINDCFQCYTIGSNRTRMIYSDSVTYDPFNPPATGGELNNEIPKMSFLVTLNQFGQISGTVYDENNLPITGATVLTDNGVFVLSDNTGHYLLSNITIGAHTVTVSKHGYNNQQHTVAVLENQNTVQNFTLVPMPTVQVHGTVLCNGTLVVPLSGAVMTLTGYENYSTVSDIDGYFLLPNVYANLTYTYELSAPGFQPINGTIHTTTSDMDLGTFCLDQYILPPQEAWAMLNPDSTTVLLSWSQPLPSAISNGYKIWRLLAGEETNPSSWILLTSNAIMDTEYTDTEWSTLVNGNYRWAVKAVYLSNYISDAALTNIVEKVTSSIDEHIVPTGTALLGSFPNPFSTNISIMYNLKQVAPVVISIYNIKGQLIRRFDIQQKNSGLQKTVWDGKDLHNRPVSSGVYLYQFKSGNYMKSGKILRLTE